MAAQYVYQGDDFDISFAAVNSDRDPLDLTDATLHCEVRASGSATTVVAAATFLDSATGGLWRARFGSWQTTDFQLVTYLFDGRVVLPNGEIHTVGHGSFIVLDPVTQEGAPVVPPTPTGTADNWTVAVPGAGVSRTLAAHLATLPDTLVTATGSTTARTLAARAADVVNVKDHGAKGDGTTDDTAAIQAAFDAVPEYGRIDLGGGTYYTTSTITISKNMTVIRSSGGYILANVGANPAIDIAHGTLAYFGANGHALDLDLAVVNYDSTIPAGSIGIRLRNSYYGRFRFALVQGFATNVQLLAATWHGSDAGISYNQFHLGVLSNHYTGLSLTNTGNSWVNQNAFYGGSFVGYASSVAPYTSAGSSHVSLTGTAYGNVNGNSFYSPSFEGFHDVGWYVAVGLANSMYSPRLEMPYATHYIKWDDASGAGSFVQSNYVHAAAPQNANLDPGKLYDTGRYGRVSANYAGVAGSGIEYVDGVWFTYVTPGGSWTATNFTTDIPRISIGGLPEQYQLISGATTSVALDYLVARSFFVDVGTGVTLSSITISNTPTVTPQRWAPIRIKFYQEGAGGNDISGFPANLLFGARTAPPVKRSQGIDVYDGVWDNNQGKFILLSQWSDANSPLIVPANVEGPAGLPIKLQGQMADGASAIGAIIGTAISFANASAKLLSVQNSGAEQMFVDYTGNIAPAADATKLLGFSGKRWNSYILTNNDGNGLTRWTVPSQAANTYKDGITSPGAGSVAHVLDTYAAYATAGGKLASVRNNGTEVAAVNQSGGFIPGQLNGGGTASSSAIHSGTGVPSNTYGANGDFYLRSDTPGTATQRLYVKSAGAWVGIL